MRRLANWAAIGACEPSLACWRSSSDKKNCAYARAALRHRRRPSYIHQLSVVAIIASFFSEQRHKNELDNMKCSTHFAYKMDVLQE